MIIRPEPAKRLFEAMSKSDMTLSLGLLLSSAKSSLKRVKTAYLRVVFVWQRGRARASAPTAQLRGYSASAEESISVLSRKYPIRGYYVNLG